MLYEEFDPEPIDFQQRVIFDINNEFDYSKGVHEILLSGAIGSAKTTLMAFVGLDHCFKYPGARVLLGRRALPDLKETIYNEIVDMIPETMQEGRGKDYWTNETKASIGFCNGSRIMSRSWQDKRYKKVRSLNITCALIEELTENDDLQFYDEIKFRVGRSEAIDEKLIVSATNPDSTRHPAYDYFFSSNHPLRHVYLSRTVDNPFLPESYVRNLMEDLDPKMAMRMLEGKWVNIYEDSIYYAYNEERNFRETDYQWSDRLPKIITFDFNIAVGKPMSMLVMQQDSKGVYHAFDEIVIEGFRTQDMCDEMSTRDWFKGPLIVCGDATGRHKDTRSKKSDWEIIEAFLANSPSVTYTMQVPRANPPIRSRHNIVNAYLINSLNEVRLLIYKKAKMLRKGLINTAFIKGSSTIEDDTKAYQHITTALGYAIHIRNKFKNDKPQGTVLM